MVEESSQYIIAYATYALQVGLLVVLFSRGQWRRLRGVTAYLAALLALDGIGRPYVLHRYGLLSHEYSYFYWLTDILLTLCSFLLICAFFRRGCAHKEGMWPVLRLFLTFVFILVLAISLPSLQRNYNNLYGIFIVEFQQNLYFTCLVLNTLLYLLLRQIESADEELSMLVCGMGLQFAGPAANFALISLTQGHKFAGYMLAYLSPLCALGMLLTWFYAIAGMPRVASATARDSEIEGMAEAAASSKA